jgi:hypothetical protein
MKIIGTHLAGVGLTLPLDDVRPLAGVTPQQVTDLLGAKYAFAMRPRANAPRMLGFQLGAPPFVFPGGPIAFSGVPAGVTANVHMPITMQNGTFSIEDRKIAIVRMDIAFDLGGLAVQTGSTEDGDLIIDDVVISLEGALGFRNINAFARRNYTSNVIVRFEKSLSEIVSFLGELCKIISPIMRGALEVEQEVDVERLAFSFDPLQLPAGKIEAGANASFVLERRVNAPYKENRYFSSAPLRTADHVRVLEQIGALIEGGS